MCLFMKYGLSWAVYPEVDDVHASPENGSRVVQRPVLGRSKRHCSRDVDFGDFNCTLHTPKGKPQYFSLCFYELLGSFASKMIDLLDLAIHFNIF